MSNYCFIKNEFLLIKSDWKLKHGSVEGWEEEVWRVGEEVVHKKIVFSLVFSTILEHSRLQMGQKIKYIMLTFC